MTLTPLWSWLLVVAVIFAGFACGLVMEKFSRPAKHEPPLSPLAERRAQRDGNHRDWLLEQLDRPDLTTMERSALNTQLLGHTDGFEFPQAAGQ